MRIAVVGAGALGSLVAGLLSVAQLDSPQQSEIWLIGAASSNEHLEAIQKNGLQLEISQSVAAQLPAHILAQLQKPLRSLHTSQQPAAIFPCDLAIVLVKSYRTEVAAQQVSQLLADDGLAISLQNGLGNAEILAGSLGAARVTQGTTILGASLPQPGWLKFAGLGATVLGTSSQLSPQNYAKLNWLKTTLEKVNAKISLSDNIESLIWGKLVVNCAVNPVAGLLNLSNGELLEHSETRRLMQAVAEEVVKVATAAGIVLPFPPEQAAAQAMHAAEINANNICSMLQDLRRNRLTEIEAINGAVVRIAEKLGVDAFVNRTLTELIRVRQQV